MAAARLGPLAFAALPLLAEAFPSMRERIPNGRRVRCPKGVAGCQPGDEVDCQPESVCHGVGHANCYGGTMPLNVFGAAFQAEGSHWTKELCQADSDGDGLTNGEELGDPCCVWQWGDDPSDYTRDFPATHPGFANSAAEVAAYKRPECSTTTPQHKATVFNRFNDNEEQRYVNYIIKNYQIPKNRTTYKWFGFNFDDDTQDIFHIVFGEALVDKKKNLHHFVMRGCTEKFKPEEVGVQLVSNQMMTCEGMFGGWAPGSGVVDVPSWMGKPIGKGVGVVAFAVQVHYDNPDGESGIVDSSGIRLWYTPTLRPVTEFTLATSMLSQNPFVKVDPSTSRWFVTKTCKLKVWDQESGAPTEFNVVSNSYHAHLLGREMYAEMLPAGSDRWVDLGSETAWHFDDQYNRDLTLRNITLRTGDMLQTTCVMDSRGHVSPVDFGQETVDEMCWTVFTGYPPVKYSCEGPIWTGRLNEGESAAGIGVKHPADSAKTVLDGKSDLLGGFPVRVDGKPYSSCEDAAPTCGIGTSAAPSFCDEGLGFVSSSLKDYAFIDLCCKTACSTTCPQHERCSGDDSGKSLSMYATGTSTLRVKPWCLPSWAKPAEPSAKPDVASTSRAAARLLALALLPALLAAGFAA